MKKRVLLLKLILFLSGCMVGPNYRQPTQLLPEVFSENRVVETPMSENELANWWTVFNDPFLNALLTESLQGNFDLLIALEKIYQARAAYWVQTTDLLPEIDADLRITRSRTSQTVVRNNLPGINPTIQNFYQAGLDVIWQIDIFGGLKRASRAACNIWQATAWDARAVKIVVLSEIALTYTNICALQELLQLARRTIRLDEELVHLASERFKAGLANEQQMDATAATLAGDKAALLVLETQLKAAIYSLAVLVGRPPETFVEQFLCARPIPNGYGRIPCGLPSDLLRRRPDIRSAERQIAAATEQIGVAVANLFPQVSLTGSSASFSSNPLQGANFGFASSSFSRWFTAPSRIWGVGGLVTLPLFDFGKRLAMIDEQISLEHQAFLTYQKTVIAALQEVESNLVAYFNEEERLQLLTEEVEANRRIFELESDLFASGLTNFTEVLNAEGNLLVSLRNLAASSQALTNNLIVLYKALGGGWECSYMP